MLYEFYVLYGSDITSLTSCHTHQTTMHKVSHAVIESEPYHTDHTVSSLNHHLHLDLDRLQLTLTLTLYTYTLTHTHGQKDGVCLRL